MHTTLKTGHFEPGYQLWKDSWITFTQLYENGTVTDQHLRRGGQLQDVAKQHLSNDVLSWEPHFH